MGVKKATLGSQDRSMGLRTETRVCQEGLKTETRKSQDRSQDRDSWVSGLRLRGFKTETRKSQDRDSWVSGLRLRGFKAETRKSQDRDSGVSRPVSRPRLVYVTCVVPVALIP